MVRGSSSSHLLRSTFAQSRKVDGYLSGYIVDLFLKWTFARLRTARMHITGEAVHTIVMFCNVTVGAYAFILGSDSKKIAANTKCATIRY